MRPSRLRLGDSSVVERMDRGFVRRFNAVAVFGQRFHYC